MVLYVELFAAGHGPTMRTPNEIADFLAMRIAAIYERPLMFGGTAACVDLLLHTCHTVWAFVEAREIDFKSTLCKALSDEHCGSANFSTRYSLNHGAASAQEIAAYVVEHWKKISQTLGIPLN